jgi:hypothetical protein
MLLMSKRLGFRHKACRDVLQRTAGGTTGAPGLYIQAPGILTSCYKFKNTMCACRLNALLSGRMGRGPATGTARSEIQARPSQDVPDVCCNETKDNSPQGLQLEFSFNLSQSAPGVFPLWLYQQTDSQNSQPAVSQPSASRQPAVRLVWVGQGQKHGSITLKPCTQAAVHAQHWGSQVKR